MSGTLLVWWCWWCWWCWVLVLLLVVLVVVLVLLLVVLVLVLVLISHLGVLDLHTSKLISANELLSFSVVLDGDLLMIDHSDDGFVDTQAPRIPNHMPHNQPAKDNLTRAIMPQNNMPYAPIAVETLRQSWIIFVN
jgi:hypothetical protein